MKKSQLAKQFCTHSKNRAKEDEYRCIVPTTVGFYGLVLSNNKMNQNQTDYEYTNTNVRLVSVMFFLLLIF